MKLVRSGMILILCIGCLTLLYHGCNKKPEFIFCGENQNWTCEFTANTTKNPKTGLYHTELQIKYKGDSLSAVQAKARLTEGDSLISSIEIDRSDSGRKINDVIRSSDGMSSFPIYSSPLTLFISLDGNEEECIYLWKNEPFGKQNN